MIVWVAPEIFLFGYFVAVARYRDQKSRSALLSGFQPILTGALTHYQNNFKKLNVNQVRFSMRYQNTQDLYDTHTIFELLACLTPGFKEQRRRRRNGK